MNSRIQVVGLVAMVLLICSAVVDVAEARQDQIRLRGTGALHGGAIEIKSQGDVVEYFDNCNPQPLSRNLRDVQDIVVGDACSAVQFPILHAIIGEVIAPLFSVFTSSGQEDESSSAAWTTDPARERLCAATRNMTYLFAVSRVDGQNEPIAAEVHFSRDQLLVGTMTIQRRDVRRIVVLPRAEKCAYFDGALPGTTVRSIQTRDYKANER